MDASLENLSDIFNMTPLRPSFDASDDSHHGRAAQSSLLLEQQRPFPTIESSPTSCGGTSVHSSTEVSFFSKDGDFFHNNFQRALEAPPTSRDRSQHETNHDNATSFLGIHPSTSRGENACPPTQAPPRLHIRPITLIKKPNMPSPLARRGAAERAYLQGQLRAESHRRRKQEQHNAERKRREHNNDIMMPIDDPNDESDSADGRIRAMVDHRNKLPISEMNNPRDPLSLATSPPTILHKSLKRSVSAVLAESGIAENGNLLFFPSGVPLLDEEGEIDPHDVEIQDGDRYINDLVGGDARFTDNGEIRSVLDDSSTDDDSQSLASADVILQFGACDDEVVITNPLLKKVTLRPKMNAPNNNNTTPGPRSDCADQASPCNSITSYDVDRTFPFPSRDSFHSEGGEVLNGSESFRRLSVLSRRRSHSSSPRPIGIMYRSDSTEKIQAVGDEISNAPESYKQLSFHDAIRKLNVEPDHRPEQEHYNAARKLRENYNNMPMNNFDDATDGHIQDMIEKFKSGFSNLSLHTDDRGRDYHYHYQDTMSFATSPPTVIQKSFKRSVSAVLADSDMAENGNLLFFPGGMPLLDEENETDRHDVVECAFVMDTDSPTSVRGRKSKVVFESGSAFYEPPPMNDASPSLVAADIIWQLGANDDDELVLKNPPSTKVTLRPKTNHTIHGPQPTHINSSVSECNSSGTLSESPGQAAPFIVCTSHTSQEDTRTSLLVSNASESFRQLSHDNEIRHCANSVSKVHPEGCDIKNALESFKQFPFPIEHRFRTDSDENPDVGSGSGSKVQFAPFSTADRSNLQQLSGESLTSSAGDFSLRESLVESNYFTPDNSEQRRSICKQAGERMPKLAELENVTGASEVCTLFQGERMRVVDDEAQKSEPKYHTPDKVEHVRRDRTQVEWMRQPPNVLPNTVITNSLKPGTVLKEPLSESNYRTPDTSEKGYPRKQVGWMMPKPQELMPTRTAESDNSMSHSKADVKNQFLQEDPAKATTLSEFNYRTPETTFYDKCLSRNGHFEQMPKLPELGLPIMSLNQFRSGHSEEDL